MDSHCPSLLSVFTTIVPWLSLPEAVRLSSCSVGFFTQLQQHDAFWRVIDMSSTQVPHAMPAFTSLIRSSLSRHGSLIKGFTFAFSDDVTDETLRLLASEGCASEAGASYDATHLQYLNLNGCVGVTDAGLKCLAQRCSTLETLALYYNAHITDDGVVPVIERNRATLKTLNFSGCRRIGDGTIKALARHCGPRLVDLDLTRTSSVSNVGLAFICGTMRGLTRLILYACHHLPPASFRSLSDCVRLEELDLCGCEVTDEDVKAIFSKCLRLRVVNLTWCTKLTDQALRYIAASAPPFQQSQATDDAAAARSGSLGLESLSLHGIRTLTPAGIEALAASRHSRTLVALDVRGCTELASQYLDHDFRGLKAAFPNLRVFQLHS